MKQFQLTRDLPNYGLSVDDVLEQDMTMNKPIGIYKKGKAWFSCEIVEKNAALETPSLENGKMNSDGSLAIGALKQDGSFEREAPSDSELLQSIPVFSEVV
jgi:hypothetical protein